MFDVFMTESANLVRPSLRESWWQEENRFFLRGDGTFQVLCLQPEKADFGQTFVPIDTFKVTSDNYTLRFYMPYQSFYYLNMLNLGLLCMLQDLRADYHVRSRQIECNVPRSNDLRNKHELERILAIVLLDGQTSDLTEIIDKANYVLTLDFTMKMIHMEERRVARVPTIVQGETGVGKTSLLRMYSALITRRETKKAKHTLLLRLADVMTKDVPNKISENEVDDPGFWDHVTAKWLQEKDNLLTEGRNPTTLVTKLWSMMEDVAHDASLQVIVDFIVCFIEKVLGNTPLLDVAQFKFILYQLCNEMPAGSLEVVDDVHEWLGVVAGDAVELQSICCY